MITLSDDVCKVPERSSICPNLPIGFGTPLVENLYSYLSRMASGYHVNLNTFINDALLPTIRRKYLDEQVRRIYAPFVNLINGKSSKIKYICEALELITELQGLESLTIAPWYELIGDNDMLKEKKAWCPDCLAEWDEAKKIIHEPLLWLMSPVKICGIHKRYLEELCPKCGQSVEFSPELTLPGYCTCGAWLGSKKRNKLILGSKLNEEIWAYESAGMLIAKNTLVKNVDEHKIRTAVKKYVTEYCADDIAKFANQVGRSRQAAWLYYLGHDRLSVKEIIAICYDHYLDPVSFIIEGKLEPIQLYLISKNILLMKDRHKEFEVIIEDIRKKIIAILNAPNAITPSIEDVARRLRLSKSMLINKFPDLSKRLCERYEKNKKNDRSIAKVLLVSELIRETTIEVYAYGAVPHWPQVVLGVIRKMASNDELTKQRQKEFIKKWEADLKASWYKTIHELGMKNYKYIFYDRWGGKIEEIPYQRLQQYPINGDEIYRRMERKIRTKIENYQVRLLESVFKGF